jgi:molybdopterin converting factor small subunit
MKVLINVLGPETRLNQEISFEPASPALQDVLRALKDRYKRQLEKFIKEDLSPTEGSAILVNGQNISSIDRLKTKIQDGDELTFTVLVAGG